MENVNNEYIDSSENGLHVDVADSDGVQIVENNGKNVVYVYFSEVPRLIGVLQRMYNSKNNK